MSSGVGAGGSGGETGVSTFNRSLVQKTDAVAPSHQCRRTRRPPAHGVKMDPIAYPERQLRATFASAPRDTPNLRLPRHRLLARHHLADDPRRNPLAMAQPSHDRVGEVLGHHDHQADPHVENPIHLRLVDRPQRLEPRKDLRHRPRPTPQHDPVAVRQGSAAGSPPVPPR